MSNKKMSIKKPIVSMTEIAQMVHLSRARFYQLLEQGFFPKSPCFLLPVLAIVGGNSSLVTKE